MSNDTIVYGWRDGPDTRGTFDIIKTCGGTILLLCWSGVCPNLPSPKSGFWARFANKFNIFLLAILGPDFIFMTALGQMGNAWQGRKLLRENRFSDWTLRHCFFANMGGVHLEFRDRKIAGLSSFPVNCEQLLYLVQQKHMTFPEISEEDIDDRNKADVLARGITIVQVLFFTINSIGRVAQGLALTTIELTTLAFVFQMACSSLCWWYKPMDISRPVTIYVDTDLATILNEASAPRVPFGQTPLSFLNWQPTFLERMWFLDVQILRTLKLKSPRTYGPAQGDHFSSIEFPTRNLKWDFYFAWTIPVYSAIFMLAWNFSFPSPVERTLWRIAATYTLVFGFIGCAIGVYVDYESMFTSWYHDMLGYLGLKTVNDTQTTSEKTRLTALYHYVSQWFDWMRNSSQNHDPMMALPLRIVLPTTFLCALYCLARGYILIEDVVALRSLPESAFQMVDWGQYSPIL